MKSMTRFLLTALLAITLPFHAAFGVAMMQSMAVGGSERMHDRSTEHSVHAAHSDRHVVQDHGLPHETHAAHDHHRAGHDSSPAEPQGSHCGACTVCCTSLGLTGMALVVPPPGAFDERTVLAEQPLTSVSPARLERPPLVL